MDVVVFGVVFAVASESWGSVTAAAFVAVAVAAAVLEASTVSMVAAPFALGAALAAVSGFVVGLGPTGQLVVFAAGSLVSWLSLWPLSNRLRSTPPTTPATFERLGARGVALADIAAGDTGLVRVEREERRAGEPVPVERTVAHGETAQRPVVEVGVVDGTYPVDVRDGSGGGHDRNGAVPPTSGQSPTCWRRDPHGPRGVPVDQPPRRRRLTGAELHARCTHMTSCRSALTRALLVAVLTLAAACGDDAVQVDTAGTPTSAAAPTTTVLDAAAAQRCSELAATMADATATLGSEVQLAVAAGPTPGLENAVGVARDAVTAFAFEFSGEPFDTHVSAFLEGLGEVPVPSAGDDGVSVPPPGEAAVGAVEQMRTAAADLAATCTAE